MMSSCDLYASAPCLSICIATYNRGAFIAETLDAVLAQLTPEVELIVVDGASEDDTSAVMARYAARHPRLVYRREGENSGIDRDFDKAVLYATGRYCWLMSDDDLMVPGAVASVLARVSGEPQLIVVNAEVRDREFRTVLKARQFDSDDDRLYGGSEHERLFSEAATYLTFIGGVIVRRDWWLGRDRAAYYGSLFVHVGVIFQQPAPTHVKVIAEPLIRIRYGNASWTPRAFEIWAVKWPGLVWSFQHFSEQARRHVSAQFPARALKTLLWYRGLGVFGFAPLSRLRASGSHRRHIHPLAPLVALLPVRLVNAGLALYCSLIRHRDARMKLYDLAHVQTSSSIARWLDARAPHGVKPAATRT